MAQERLFRQPLKHGEPGGGGVKIFRTGTDNESQAGMVVNVAYRGTLPAHKPLMIEEETAWIKRANIAITLIVLYSVSCSLAKFFELTTVCFTLWLKSAKRLV